MPIFHNIKDFQSANTQTPKRIVSVVPSQTELLFDLGLEEEVVGITKFCVHPDKWFHNKRRIGGTKQLNLQKIADLQPDLIIANKEENEKEQIEALAKDFNVFVTDVKTIEEAISMIEEVGELVHKKEKGISIAQQVRLQFDKINPLENNLTVAYFIWEKPYMTVGGDTYIHSVLHKMGLKNVFENTSRYPAITNEEIVAANPKIVFLSSEPFPFGQKHVHQLKQLLPNAEVLIVDGEMFSWYGSRMQLSPTYLLELIYKLKKIAIQ